MNYKQLVMAGLLCCSALGLNACQAAQKAEPVVAPQPTPREKVQSLVQSLSLEEKVGQLLVVGIPGTQLDSTARAMVEQYHVGGIIHFDRNLQTPAQVKELNSSLQSLSRFPLYVAVDQEGGQVARMRDYLVVAPSAAQIGATGDPEQARKWAVQTAQSLKSMGFNTNFAPVADLGFTAGRSYGTTAATVTPFVEAAVAGYAQEQVIASVKHFPGIGRAMTDPHQAPSRITASWEELGQTDFKPFFTMVRQHEQAQYMLMVSHLIYPAFDEEPACTSPALLTKLLREEWGYEGVVITDDLDMGGVAQIYSAQQRGVKALQAGADILLSCGGDGRNTRILYQSVLEACQKGTISTQRLDASVERVLWQKYKNGLLAL